MRKVNTHRQRGASTTDLLIWASIVIIALIFVISKVPDIRYASNLSKFQSDASAISDGAYRWKKMRPNYTGISINILCTEKYIPESICGSSNNGVSTNSFGGNWTVTANSNPGLFNIGATIPNDPGRMNDIADTMAPATRGNCTAASGCSTITAAGTSLTMTY
ncbi:hypothetical protein J3L11_14655 [Shewanella sp. 4t3-1-2LB]|uniref:type 4 pilus major pilin n=1 Tax=Shewanella sp. 4t3-1-2LB TaxID=2817682 RepID=UPI001A987BBD|nr:type 4 pilus major pilin [Shewanella sp. 4t3-1-2LB]MBO1272885.1 hypothetical protein [Shewanella sp. 4t3-1-2LB]